MFIRSINGTIVFLSHIDQIRVRANAGEVVANSTTEPEYFWVLFKGTLLECDAYLEEFTAELRALMPQVRVDPAALVADIDGGSDE